MGYHTAASLLVVARPTPLSAPVGSHPPGPTGLPLLGTLPWFWRDPLGTLLDGWRRYGDVVRFPRLDRPAYLLARPDDIQQVLQLRSAEFPKSAHYKRLRSLIGEGILTDEGPAWRRQRQLIQPFLLPDRVQGLGPLIVEATDRMLARWEAPARGGVAVDVAAELGLLALAVASRALFSSDLGPDAALVRRALVVGQRHITRPFLWLLDPDGRLPLPRSARYRRARRGLDAALSRLIDERRATGPRADLLDRLMEGSEGARLDGEIVNLLFAGHDTTANAMTWTLALLGQHREAAERLRGELDAALGGRAPTPDDLARAPYLGWVLQETLRLYPTVWTLSRTPREPLALREYQLPAGALIYLSAYITHRHPACWEAPERFDPERFSPSRSADRPRLAYFPFGAGPRQCLGASLALLEGQLVLARLLQRYRFELMPDQELRAEPQITLRLRGGLPVRLQPRA